MTPILVQDDLRAGGVKGVFSFDMTDGTLYILGSDSENTWITPENYHEGGCGRFGAIAPIELRAIAGWIVADSSAVTAKPGI